MIVVGLSHEGPELVVTACSAFVLKVFVQVEDAHDAGATDHKRFLCSQVHQRDRRRSFTADPLRLDRCAAVVERTNEGASERCPMTGWSSSLNFIGRRRGRPRAP